MKQLFVIIFLASLLFPIPLAKIDADMQSATVATPTAEPTLTPLPKPSSTPSPKNASRLTSAAPSLPQGMGPFGIAITQDGKYAYINFDLSEVVFKVRLQDFAVEAVADLSAYFPVESEQLALDASEKKLFVHTPTWRKLLVLDTQTMSVIRTIDDLGAIGIIRAQDGSLIVWDGGNTVKFVNTETYAVTSWTDSQVKFVKILENQSDPSRWYFVAGSPSEGYAAGIYNKQTQTWINKIPLSLQVVGEAIFDLQVLPNKQKAYVATFGGWYPEFHAYGWLYSIDLLGGQIKVIPIDGGALCLVASTDNQRVYIGTGWPIPNVNNLLVLDAQSDTVVGQISLGQNKYGWHYTQMNNLKIDPTNPNILYATTADGNALIKARLDSRTLTDVLVFNRENLKPHFFATQLTQPYGYVLIRKSANAFTFDLDSASVKNLIAFPSIRSDADAYDVVMNNAGRLLIAQGEQILEVNAADLSLIASHPLPAGTPSVWAFVLSNDQTRLYSITQDPSTGGNVPNIFMAISTANFQVQKRFTLDGGSFEFRPFELPNGTKLYALGGMQNGAVVIHVIRTDNLTIQKTMTFSQPGSLGISAGPYWPYAYDSNSHTLFVGATYVVLAIDTNTDEIKKVIPLGDAAKAIGLQPEQLTYINAIGLVYNPQENYLYIDHFDRSFVSIYDLNNSRFLSKAIPLKGYGPGFLFANSSYSKIYSLNPRSDSISVIDVISKAVEKVIDLNDYLNRLFLPLILKSTQ